MQASANKTTELRAAAQPAAELPCWPYYERDEQEAVQAALASGRVNYWTGEEARQFEREYAAQAGVRYAVALANGTVALELALLSGGIGEGDEVVTSPRTFVASASCAVSLRARPIFADVDGDSQNITAETIERVLTPRTKAIVVVHLAGWPCEMDAILELARGRNLLVVEDCAQANGALYRGRPVGSLGTVGAFSFCQDKIITTGGEGGLLTTNDEALWSRAWSYKDHGKSYDAVYNRQHGIGYRWLHESFGTNWRMTELQAAIGRVQLRKLDRWVDARRRNAAILQSELSSLAAVRIPTPPAHIHHAYYRFYFFVERAALKQSWSRERIVAEIAAAGIPSSVGSCSEVYLEKAFQDAGLSPAQPLRMTHELGATSVALLVHPTLESIHMERTAAVVKDVLLQAVK